MSNEITIPAEVAAKLALIGSKIIGHPEQRQRPANDSDRAKVGWWFRSKGRCYICIDAGNPGRYISTGQYLDGGNRAGMSDMDGVMIGWQQPQEYTAVEISEPTTPDAKPVIPAPDYSADLAAARAQVALGEDRDWRVIVHAMTVSGKLASSGLRGASALSKLSDAELIALLS